MQKGLHWPKDFFLRQISFGKKKYKNPPNNSSAEAIAVLTNTDPQNDSRILKTASASRRAGLNPFYFGKASRRTINRVQNLKFCRTHITRRRCPENVSLICRHLLSCIELYWSIAPSIFRLTPKIIHCNDFITLPLGVTCKFISRAKLIYDAHELASDRNGLAKYLQPVVRFAERCLWPFVDYFITVSPSIANWYQHEMGAKPTTVILNSPVLQASAAIKINYLRERFSIPDGSPIFIYVGMLAPGRGLDLLLRTFSRKKMKAHLVFLGEGELSERISQQTKIQGNLHLHSPVAHDEVVSVVQSADVGCCLIENVSLSDFLSLPNKLFEYAFAGKPVLASDFPEIRNFVHTFQCGVCTQLNEKSVVEAVYTLLANFKDYKIPQDRLAEVSWEAQEQKLVEVYRDLAGKL